MTSCDPERCSNGELAHLVSSLLRLEQQLEAYQELYANELAELRRSLNECKRQIADALPESVPLPGEDTSQVR